MASKSAGKDVCVDTQELTRRRVGLSMIRTANLALSNLRFGDTPEAKAVVEAYIEHENGDADILASMALSEACGLGFDVETYRYPDGADIFYLEG